MIAWIRIFRVLTTVFGADWFFASTRRPGSKSWNGEAVEARQRAVDALAEFESAVREMGLTAGAEAWVKSGAVDDRWDRRVPSMVVGTIAESSRRRTANSEPLRVDELVGYLREALEPPQPTPAVILGATVEA